MSFIIHQVATSKDKQDFLEVARVIYREDPNWICPMDKQLHTIFEPASNNYFTHGFAERWILKGPEGTLIGRIAAFVDTDKQINSEIKAGGLGFFECINDQNAANLLFDTVRAWLSAKEVEAMDGPINFGENDRFWGLLVEGFTAPPFTTNYNPPYYRRLFEQYGFQVYYEMNSNQIDLKRPFPERFEKISNWINQKEGIEFRNPAKNQLGLYAQYFREIYNQAWQFHEAFKPMSEERAKKFAKEIRFLFIRQMITFAFIRNEPAGFLVATPDLNQIFKDFRGKLNLIQRVLFLWRSRNDFLWYRKRGMLTRVHVIAIGIKPRFQQYGLETGMFMYSKQDILDMNFDTAELRWAGDFNPKIERLHKAVGAIPIRKHITFRYLFSRDRDFKRYKEIGLSRSGG